MLFACDRDRFRDVNWIRALDAAASARVDLEHLLAVDAEGHAEGILWLPYYLVPFANLESRLLGR